jgi:ketosteroid isomerase-like protein
MKLKSWTFLAALFTAVGNAAVAPAPSLQIPADPAQLRQLVLELDRKMFDAYNAHDVPRLMSWFAPDVEFFQDTEGLAGFQDIQSSLTNVLADNKDIRRDLVAEGVEVYPIKDYGAIQIGRHRFCHTENGKPDCGTFRFVRVWRLKDGAWKVAREISFGH